MTQSQTWHGCRGMLDSKSVHAQLVWLEKHVRQPLQGTMLDVYIASPLKDVYCRLRKQA